MVKGRSVSGKRRVPAPSLQLSKRAKLLLVTGLAILVVLALVAVEFNFMNTTKPNNNNNIKPDRPPKNGDWYIEKTILVEGEKLVVNGNLTVNSVGKLILRNSTLNFTCATSRSFRVVEGGELHVIDSNIDHRGVETDCRIDIEDDSILEMKGSSLTLGLRLEAGGANIDKVKMTGKYAGIVIFSSDNKITGSTIAGSDDPEAANAIWMDNGTGNVFSGNHMSGFGSGITFRNSSRNTITNNSITTRSSGNGVTGSGIQFFGSGNNLLTYNDIFNCEDAVFMMDSSNNTFHHNDVYNSNVGISLMNSTNDLFHHNNFKNNKKQAEDDRTNSFDDGKDGNYWSDYIGMDLNKDGKGDIPYFITLSDRDRHPFMKPVP